ncbi:MAG: TonB-dependent receptor [Gammaproteobacteria bacterium]
MRLSFDWTRITKHDNIVNVTFNQSALNNENNLPGLVARAAPAAGDAFGVGKVIGFDSRFINATRARSDSYDIALDYKHETSAYGTFSAQLIGTQLSSNLLQLTPGAVGQERAGTYVSPKWSANGSLSWRWRGLDVQWAAQYLDSYWINADHSVVVLQASGRLGSAVYHDITAGYRFNESVRDGISAALSNLDVRVGVKNVFNRKPRYLTNNNFYYDTWSSPMMSTYYLTLQKRF